MNEKFSIEEMSKYIEEIFPQISGKYRILKLTDCSSEVQLVATKSNLRPGNTISGPTMFELADIAFYLAVLSLPGSETLALTTNVSINFLRRPSCSNLVAVARIKKSGRQLVVGDVEIFSEDMLQVVAHAIFTYSLPPRIN